MFEIYDKEMRSFLAEIMSSRVVLAALDKSTHERLSEFADRLYQMDVEFSEAALLFQNSSEAGIVALAKLHEKTLLFDKEFLEIATNLFP
jgi:hypothetical protein